MSNNKSAGNDAITKTFWDELKTPLLTCINQALIVILLNKQ